MVLDLDKIFGNKEASGEDKLLYLINTTSTDGTLYGRKKLTKLGFLAEHWLPDEEILSDQQNLENFNFIIYKFGPFSKDLFKSFDRLKDDNLIEEKRRPRGRSRIDVTEEGMNRIQQINKYIPETEKEQIKAVSEHFSHESGGGLEQISLDLIGIDKSEKQDYMGMPVDVIISETS